MEILAALLAVAALALLWLGFDSWRQSRRLARIEERLDAADARNERLQSALEGRGWGDSLHLTRINWQKPGPF